MISFNFVAYCERSVFFEKSKTSSDRSLRILRAFSQRAYEDLASEQISVIKFYQDDVHSCLTIDIRVALSFVSRCWLCYIIVSSSESLRTRLIINVLIPFFWSSGIIFHLVYNKIKKRIMLTLTASSRIWSAKNLVLGFDACWRILSTTNHESGFDLNLFKMSLATTLYQS